MKVMMTDFAKNQIRKTANYIKKEFGHQSKDKFLLEVRQTKCLLETNPYIGSIEPLLADRSTTYYSIVVNHLSKMAYRIMDDHLEVADFWDTRREPKKQAEQTK